MFLADGLFGLIHSFMLGVTNLGREQVVLLLILNALGCCVFVVKSTAVDVLSLSRVYLIDVRNEG